MITKSHVKHIASLACLELSEDDLQEFTVQFNSILSYFDELSEIKEIAFPPVLDTMPTLTWSYQ